MPISAPKWPRDYQYEFPGTVWRPHGVYDVRKLWAVANKLHTTQIEISTLMGNLQKETWVSSLHPYAVITPQQVLDDPELSPGDAKRIINADMTFPLIVHGTDVLDGKHRLARAVLLGYTTIGCKMVNDKMLRECVATPIQHSLEQSRAWPVESRSDRSRRVWGSW